MRKEEAASIIKKLAFDPLCVALLKFVQGAASRYLCSTEHEIARTGTKDKVATAPQRNLPR